MKEKNKRVVVYMPPSLFRKIKISVVTQGIDFSEWVRRKAQEEIEQNNQTGGQHEKDHK